MKRATCRLVLALALAAVLVAAAGGAAPPRPGLVRLTAEQEKQIELLLQRLERAREANRFEEAEQHIRQIAELRRTWQGKDHWEAVNARFVVEAARRWTKVPARDRPAVVRAQRLLGEGNRLQDQQRFAEAEARHREALAIRRQVLGDEHPDTVLSLENVGLCLNDQGRYAQAQPLFEKAVRLSRKVLGEEHSATARGYNHLAACLMAQGKHAQAQPLLEKAVGISRQVLGEEHPTTLLASGDLADNLKAQGKHAQAQRLHEQVLAGLRRVLGRDHRLTARACSSLASCLDVQGKHAQAQPLHERALAIRVAVLGEEHPDTAQACNNLAFCLNAQAHYARAQPLFERALAVRRRALGELHPVTAESWNNVAYNRHVQGQYALAQPLYEKALGIWRQSMGDFHPHTATCYNNLAWCLGQQGKHAQALPLYEKALAICRQVLPEAHPDTARGYNNLAHCLGDLGKYELARPLFEKALAIGRQVLGEGHPDTATYCGNLAFILAALGEQARAQALYERALAVQRRARGEEHPDTARGYGNVAYCLHEQGKYVQAQPLYEKALAISRKMLGEQHPDTALACTGLGRNLHAQGQYARAVECWKAALLGHECGRLGLEPSGFGRSLFRADLVSPRTYLAAGLARLGKPLEAFHQAESQFARGLLDELAGPAAVSPAAAERLARLRQLERKLEALAGRADLQAGQRQERERALQERKQLLLLLARENAERVEKRTCSLERIQEQLPADAALVFWLDLVQECWGCVLRRQGPPAWVRLAPLARDRWGRSRDGLELYRALSRPDGESTRIARLAAAQRKQLLGPLQAHLRDRGKLPVVRRLLVVPVGPAAEVPVEVLAPEYVVSYVPSGSVFARLAQQQRRLRGTSLLAVGDPCFRPAGQDQAEPPPHGLLVTTVVPGGSADRAGLRPGDVLLACGGRKLEGPEDLAPVKEVVRGLYWRDGRQATIRLRPGPLGAVFDPRSARAAVRAWRRRSAPVVQRDSDHAPLPGTAFEVRALRRLVGEKATTLLTGSLASEQQLERMARAGYLKRFRLLHLATHGQVDWQRPEQSALVLAQDRLPDPVEQARRGQKVYDGRLTVGTILRDWQLDADLVVLSACQTALGRYTTGEGLLGFTQAFLQKGARAVVLSRWKVEDTATALLMVRFYENLLGKRTGLKKGMGRAAALAEAKKWLRQLPRKRAAVLAAYHAGGVLRGTEADALPLVKGKATKIPEGDKPFARPFYWAAFVLVGDPS